MALSVGDLAINITTSIASFVSGIQEATNRLNRFASDASSVANQAKSQFEKIGNVFKTIATFTVAGIGINAFTSMIEGAIDAQAHLKDLGEMAGTTAAKMSALIPAARLSGTSMDDVAQGATKFAKQLGEIQNGTGKAGEAFKRLGFSAEDAARFLKDPAQGLLEVAQASNKFTDDGNKNVIMQQVLGKSAAGLASFMKELGQQTELVSRVTNEQAEAADRLQDQYALIKLGGEEMRIAFANSVIPTLSQVALGFLAAKEGGAGFFQAIAIATVGQDKVIERITELGAKVAETKKAIDDASQPVANELFGANDQTEALKILNATLDESAKKLKIYQQIRDQTIFNKLAGQDIGDASDRLAGNSAARRPSYKGSLDSSGLKDDVTKLDDFTKAMQNAREMTAEANAALAALVNGTDKLTQADSALLKIQASEAWKTFSKTQRNTLIDTLDATSATQKLVAAQTSYAKILDEMNAKDTGFDDNFAGDLAVLDTLLDAGAIKLAAYGKAIDFLLDKQPFAKKQAEALKEQAEALQRLDDLMRNSRLNDVQQFVDFTRNLKDQNDEIKFQTSLLGLTAQEQEKLTALHRIDVDVQKELLQLSEFADQADRDRITTAGEVAKRNVGAAIDARQQIEKGLENTKTVFGELDSVARDVWNSIGGKATNMWQKIKDDGKRILLDFLYSLTVKPFLISIAASLTGVSGQAAANLLNPQGGGAGGLGLPGTGGAVGFDETGITLSNPLAGASDFLGNAFSQGVENFALATGEFGEGMIALEGIAGTIGAAIPYIGVALLAAQALGLFDKKPSEVRGQFQIGGTGFEDNVSTSTRFGAIGFADAGTQQFSGEAAQLFNKVVAGALDAFDQRYTAEQRDRLTEILSKTTFPEASGSFTTEDFLKTYGAQVLQQVIVAAFDVLDPALGAVAASFKGTADEIVKFANTLLSIHDATELFRDNAATGGLADAIAAFTLNADSLVVPLTTGIDDALSQVQPDPTALTGAVQQAVDGAVVAVKPDVKPLTATVNAGIDDAIAKTSPDASSLTSKVARGIDDALSQVSPDATSLTDAVQTAIDKAIVPAKGPAVRSDGTPIATTAADDAGKQFVDRFVTNINAALEGATQETADKVLAFVNVVNGLSGSLPGLAVQIASLDATKITAFVDALGGAQAFASKFASFSANFGTQAQTTANATTRLATVFGSLGIAVPQTHADFVKVVEDMIAMGNTDAVAALLGVSDAFVTLHGTAESLRQALLSAAAAGRSYYEEHFLTPAERLSQRQTVDSTAIFDATRQTTELGRALHLLGDDDLPLTVEGIKGVRRQLVALYGEGSAVVLQFDAVIPSVGDLIDSVGGFGDAATDAADTIVKATHTIEGEVTATKGIIAQNIADLANLAGQSPDFGAQLATNVTLLQGKINQVNAAIDSAKSSGDFSKATLDPLNAALKAYQDAQGDVAAELRNFLDLSNQYGAARAEQLVKLEQWYEDQKKVFEGGGGIYADPGALAVLAADFQQRWDDIINGAADAATSLDDFIKSIQGIADATGGNAGQQAGIELALSKAKLTDLETKFAAALPGSALATALAADIARLQTYNAGLAVQIAHFATYSQQYGAATADQLVELENQFEVWKQSVAGNAEALAIVTDIFNERFAAIIAGVGSGVDELGKIQQSIAEYLRGLVLSDLSPKTPQEKLDQSQAAYIEELIKAQSGDLTAMGDITQFADAYLKQAREFYASAPQFTDIYNAITEQLAALAGTTPTGLPLTPASDAAQITNGLQTVAATTQSSAATIVDAVGDAAVVIAAAVATNVQPAQPQAAPTSSAEPTSATGADQQAILAAALEAALPDTGTLLSGDDLRAEVAKLIAAWNASAASIADAGTEDSKALQDEMRLRLLAIEEALSVRG